MTRSPRTILRKAYLPAMAMAGLVALGASSHANAATVTIISNTETPLPSSIISDTLDFSLSGGSADVIESGAQGGFSPGGAYTAGLSSVTTGADGYSSSAIIPFSPNEFFLSLGNLAPGLYSTVIKGFSANGYGSLDLGIGTVGAVPLPGALWMFGAGIMGLSALAYRRRAIRAEIRPVAFA